MHSHNQLTNKSNSQVPTIILFHHPKNWFADYSENNNAFDYLLNKANIIINGHEHKSDYNLDLKENTLLLKLGSSYQENYYNNSCFLLRFKKNSMYFQLQEIEWNPDIEKWVVNYGLTWEGNLGVDKQANMTQFISIINELELDGECKDHIIKGINNKFSRLPVFDRIKKEEAEIIRDEDYLYRRIHVTFMRGEDRIGSSSFRFLNNMLDCDWGKYTSAEKALERAKDPEANYLVKIKVKDLRKHQYLDVIHDPVPFHKSHSIILIKKPQINKSFMNKLRLFLSEISEVVIHPPLDINKKKK